MRVASVKVAIVRSSHDAAPSTEPVSPGLRVCWTLWCRCDERRQRRYSTRGFGRNMAWSPWWSFVTNGALPLTRASSFPVRRLTGSSLVVHLVDSKGVDVERRVNTGSLGPRLVKMLWLLGAQK